LSEDTRRGFGLVLGGFTDFTDEGWRLQLTLTAREEFILLDKRSIGDSQYQQRNGKLCVDEVRANPNRFLPVCPSTPAIKGVKSDHIVKLMII
jgi:hypothetical protein